MSYSERKTEKGFQADVVVPHRPDASTMDLARKIERDLPTKYAWLADFTDPQTRPPLARVRVTRGPATSAEKARLRSFTRITKAGREIEEEPQLSLAELGILK